MAKQYFKKGETIRQYEVIGDKVNCYCEELGIYNPTLTQFHGAGWEDYTPPEPEPYVPTYEEKVVQLIREQYDENDEAKYSRWNIEVNILKTKTLTDDEIAELTAYSEYVAWCHEEAKKNE